MKIRVVNILLKSPDLPFKFCNPAYLFFNCFSGIFIALYIPTARFLYVRTRNRFSCHIEDAAELYLQSGKQQGFTEGEHDA